MTTPEQATQTQLANIQKKTGKTLDELASFVGGSGLTRHGEIRDMLKDRLGLGHGDANTLTHVVLASDGARAAAGKSDTEVLDGIYTGAKVGFRPIHEALMAEIGRFGAFEVAPKKGYVSLRRARQFAMIGPKTNTRFEVGLNCRDLPAHARLVEQPKGSMCSHVVALTDVSGVDAELVGWLRTAYEAAG